MLAEPEPPCEGWSAARPSTLNHQLSTSSMKRMGFCEWIGQTRICAVETKIDIFFRYTARAIAAGAQSETNVKCLDTTPLPFDSIRLFVLRAPARWRHTLRRVSRTAHVVVCEHRKKERL